MSDSKDNKVRDEVRRLAAEFFARESNGTSLITITGVQISDRGSQAKVLFTVLPESSEKGALDFAKRQRTEFREYVMEQSRIGRVPFFDFEIDSGEKNRQAIDRITYGLENKA
jgi:ribosome-binding factor A